MKSNRFLAHLTAEELGLKINASLYYNKGLALEELGKYEDANEALEKASILRQLVLLVTRPSTLSFFWGRQLIGIVMETFRDKTWSDESQL